MKKNETNAGIRRLFSDSGMTLAELLASLLILSMLTLVISGGVMAVKHAYEKVVRRADAEQVLATTVELMTGELSSALDVDENAETDPVESSLFLSGKEHAWVRFSVDPEHGISRVYENGTIERGIPLLSEGAMADQFYTAFERCTYGNACFTVKNISVYEKNRSGTGTGTPVAVLPELKVRAVNLEER